MATDHANLVFAFGKTRDISKASSARLKRWALKLSGLNFTIEHIEREKNAWADMLSRWGAVQRELITSRLYLTPNIPSVDQVLDSEWPNLTSIVEAQHIRVKRSSNEDLGIIL